MLRLLTGKRRMAKSNQAAAWKNAMIEQGEKKSEKYWNTYKTTNLMVALDPSLEILAFPPPPHPPVEPAFWQQSK